MGLAGRIARDTVDADAPTQHIAAMRFFSDNAAPVHPAVLAALGQANSLDTAYDGDAWSRQLDGRFSDLFGTAVKALWVPSGWLAKADETY